MAKLKQAIIDLTGCERCQVYAAVSETSKSCKQFHADQKIHMRNAHGILMA